MQPNGLVADSSTLIAFERANLLHLLEKVPNTFLVPPAVGEELGHIPLKNITVVPLRGRSIQRAAHLVSNGIDRGEAECLILAQRLRTGFILCDDRKFLRQVAFLTDPLLREISIGGFGHILDFLCAEKEIPSVWDHFHTIIEKNNWTRSEVSTVNFMFLKDCGW